MKTISREQFLEAYPEAEVKDSYTAIDVLRQHTNGPEALDALACVEELDEPVVMGEFACRAAEHVLLFIENLAPDENIFRVALQYRRQMLFKGRPREAYSGVFHRLDEVVEWAKENWEPYQAFAAVAVWYAVEGDWVEAATCALKAIEQVGMLNCEAEEVWQIKTLIHLIERGS